MHSTITVRLTDAYFMSKSYSIYIVNFNSIGKIDVTLVELIILQWFHST